MNTTELWLMFAVIGLGTFTLRFLFIYLFGKIEMPDWLRRALRFVPAAALAALVFPALTYTGTELNLSWHNPRLLAGLLSALVAWNTRNVLWTLGVGMALLWVFQVLL